MKRIFVLGFQPYDETMYPHLYDFLKMLEESFKVVYLGTDDRGQRLVTRGGCFPSAKTCFGSPRVLAGNIYSSIRYSIANLKLDSQIETIMHDGIDVAVAIDHSALNRVAAFSNDRTKMVYWSHDYIPPDRDWYGYRSIRSMLKRNALNIAKCAYIVVQDPNRAAVLDSIIGSHKVRKIFLPVSVEDDEFARGVARAKMNKSPSARTVIMQITARHDRASDLLIEAYQSIGEQIEVCFQGHVSSEIRALIAGQVRKPAVFDLSGAFSTMRGNISKSDIGFISYRMKDLNHHFVSRSCGQMVEFIRLGIPVIVMDSIELGEYAENHGCGVYIPNILGLKNAVDKIVDSYTAYSKSARDLYEAVFNLQKYRGQLLYTLSNL